jgi:hypothetical protein
MKWTHPICSGCYDKRYPDKEPLAVNGEMAILEQCCDCGSKTNEGIYFRADPRTLAYPAQNAD